MAASSFPPNPEDGDLWLPSYLFHEIALSTATFVATPQPSSHHHAPNKKQVRDILHGVKPNAKAIIGNDQPCFDHPYYNDPFLNSPLQFLPPEPFYPPNPIISPNQFLGYNCKISSCKSEGTGVFLPGSVTSSKKTKNIGENKGKGVFLNHQAKVKPKKGGENGKHDIEKKTSLKEEVRAKTQDPSDHICLP